MEPQTTQQSTLNKTGLGNTPTYLATIQSLTSLSRSVIHCRLTTNESIPYQPGQYAMVAINHTARAYSFATPANQPTIEFLIDTRPQGIASHFWQQATERQTLTLTAPYGHFLLDQNDTRPLLFIAGSTGLAPLHAHIRWLLQQRSARPITLIVGHSQAADTFWEKELGNLAQQKNFTYQSVTGPLASTLSTTHNLVQHTTYLCGSAAMVTKTAEFLYQNGLPPRHVHYELFT